MKADGFHEAAVRRKKKQLLLILLVLDLLCIAFILTRSLKPAADSNEESGRLLRFFLRIFPWMTMKFVRKLAHFTEFFILGVLLWATCRDLWRPMFWLPLGFATLVACTDELIQLFVPGRSGQLSDVALDCCGSLAGVALCMLLSWLRRRRRKQA